MIATLKLILKEISHGKVNFFLSCFALFSAVALYVAFATSGEAYRRETRRIMRNMGQNLRIIPKETRLDEFWMSGFSERTMPEDYVYRFADIKGFSYTHLTATLQGKVVWRDMRVVLTGILPEVLPLDKRQQSPMMFAVEPNTIVVGYEVARTGDLKSGDEIDLLGKRLRVAKCLSNSGSMDDIRVYGHLHDVQELLRLKGQINEIRALECLCIIESGAVTTDAFTLAKQQLAQIMPEAQVILLQEMAKIRQDQRAAMDGYLQLLMLFIITACGVWIGILAMINVKEREHEIGILRALGHGGGKIAGLFVGKSIVVGLVGAIPGSLAGTLVALTLGPDIFKITAQAIRPEVGLLVRASCIAPVFSVISSFIPAMVAVGQDPSLTLRNE